MEAANKTARIFQILVGIVYLISGAIKTWEPVKRGMFTGLTGWMDSEGNGQWIITLRSGVLDGRAIEIGAGAGIVPGSDPVEEWEETTGKLKTMQDAIRASCRRRSYECFSQLA